MSVLKKKKREEKQQHEKQHLASFGDGFVEINKSLTRPGDYSTVEGQGGNPCKGGGDAEDGNEGGEEEGEGGQAGRVEGDGGRHPLLLLVRRHL